MSIPDAKEIVPAFTYKQGQSLAFIHYYTKVNGIAPVQADLQRYFRVSPPSVHRMLAQLENQGLITKLPGVARNLSLVIPRSQLPALD